MLHVGFCWFNWTGNPILRGFSALPSLRLAEAVEPKYMRERWLSVDEIAAHLGVNPDTIYKWIDRKKMPAHKLGRLWKFLASEVDAWVLKGLAGRHNGPKSKQR
jgi:excisionase family DNA binding protein